MMETTQAIPVTFTDKAIEEINRLRTEQNSDAQNVLRIGVKGGGCSGMSYLLAFDHKEENDREFLIHDIPVVVNRTHEMYIWGMQIDWQDGLNSRGFTFNNPNAKSTCGCGTSFTA